jgi:hypothetical protein
MGISGSLKIYIYMLGTSNESLPEDFLFLSRNHGKTMGNIAYHIAYHIAYQSRGFVSWDSHRKKPLKPAHHG